jgi:hypothetical protein
MKKILISALAFASFACSSNPENEFIGTWVISDKPKEVKLISNPDTLRIIQDNETTILKTGKNETPLKFDSELKTYNANGVFGTTITLRINEKENLILTSLKSNEYKKIE